MGPTWWSRTREPEARVLRATASPETAARRPRVGGEPRRRPSARADVHRLPPDPRAGANHEPQLQGPRLRPDRDDDARWALRVANRFAGRWAPSIQALGGRVAADNTKGG